MKNSVKKKLEKRGIVVPRGNAATRTPIPGARAFKDRRRDAQRHDERSQMRER